MSEENLSHSFSPSLSKTSVVIARAPTWFQQSTACSNWTDDGRADFFYISYEMLNVFSIYFESSDDNRGYFIGHRQQFKAHDDKINGVAFCASLGCASSRLSFASCGNDRYIRTWTLSSELYELDKQICLRQDIVPNACAACYLADCCYVLAASLHGHIIVWVPSDQRVAGSPLIKKFEKDAASVCSWLPPSGDSTNILGIVGFKSGDVCCYSYEASTVFKDSSLTSVFRIHAHDFEVCGLTPVKLKAENGTRFASSGRDSSVKVWSTTEAKCVHISRFQFRQKNTTGSQQPNPFANATAITSQGKAWIPIAMTTDDSAPPLLAFDAKGNLFSLDCVDKPLPCETPNALRHTGVVFNFLPVPESANLFISLGMDGRIIVWKCDHGDWKALKPVASHVSLNGKVSSMSQGPGVCSPLAVGVTDGSLILLRNMAPPAPNAPVSMTRLTPLPLPSPFGISAMAWHPDPQYENLLAVGSVKGHIDVVDVTKPSKPGRTFNNLEGCVYRVAWGPRLFKKASAEKEADEEPRLFVYAISKGRIYILLSSKNPPANMTDNFSKFLSHSSDVKLSDVSFRRELSSKFPTPYSWLIALGSVNGAVNVLGLQPSGCLSPLFRFSQHKKCINAMAWSKHPDRYLLAVGSNHPFITVVDASSYALAEPQPDSTNAVQLTSCLATLEGHGNRVVGLEWSPHDPDFLLSASFDWTATVWRVELGASVAVANYRGHFSPLYACAWSVQQPDFVHTGEGFGCVAGWRPSEQSTKSPPAVRRHRQPAATIPTHGQGDVAQALLEKDHHRQNDEEDSAARAKIEPVAFPKKGASASTSSTAKQLSLLPSLFATPSATDCPMLSLTQSPPIQLPGRLSVIRDFVTFLQDPAEVPEDRMLPEFCLLHASTGGRRRLLRFTESEALKHLAASSSGANRQSQLDAYYSLLLWLGRTEAVRRACVETQYMPFWLMWALEMCFQGTMSRRGGGCLIEEAEEPLDGTDFLQQKVLQMRDSSNDFNRAATLLVCASRTTDAVRLLLSRGRAKEALLLFRLRLAPSACPNLLAECLSLLADRQAHTGLPNSVLAFLAAGRHEIAADAVSAFAASPSAPPIDHIAALSVAIRISPQDHLSDFKLAHNVLIYAASLAVEEERRQFLEGWGCDRYLYACGLFLLTEESPSPSVLQGQDTPWLAFAADRQPSLEEAHCLAAVVVDFAVAVATGEIKHLDKSLDRLRLHHPASLSTLIDRITRKRPEGTATNPNAFEQIACLICTES